MESEQLGKRRRRRCAVVGCDRDTGQISRPILLNPPSGQIEEWKRAICYTGQATKEFWICDGHFSDHQFLDERNTRLGLPLRRDKLHLKPTAVPDQNICHGAKIMRMSNNNNTSHNLNLLAAAAVVSRRNINNEH